MIVLNRKRLVLVVSMVFVGLFAFTFQTANLNKTVQTVALPVSNKVIVIDARTSESQMKEQKVAMVQQKQQQILKLHLNCKVYSSKAVQQLY